MWRALVKASVLNEMFLALRTHSTTVIPVEVVQVRVVQVGLFSGVGSTTCIFPPGSTLERRRGFVIGTKTWASSHSGIIIPIKISVVLMKYL